MKDRWNNQKFSSNCHQFWINQRDDTTYLSAALPRRKLTKLSVLCKRCNSLFQGLIISYSSERTILILPYMGGSLPGMSLKLFLTLRLGGQFFSTLRLIPGAYSYTTYPTQVYSIVYIHIYNMRINDFHPTLYESWVSMRWSVTHGSSHYFLPTCHVAGLAD